MDDIYDVLALRVVLADKHDCYKAMRAAHGLWRCVPGRYKDYIRAPKKDNGYQSLHDTLVGPDGLPFEVQVRALALDWQRLLWLPPTLLLLLLQQLSALLRGSLIHCAPAACHSLLCAPHRKRCCA